MNSHTDILQGITASVRPTGLKRGKPRGSLWAKTLANGKGPKQTAVLLWVER